MTSPDRIRLMTLSLQPVQEYRTRYSRWSGLFGSFADRYDLEFARPELSPREQWVSRLRHLHPRRSVIQARAAFNEDTFARRSRHAEQALTEADRTFDVIFQLQTLFAPGLRPRPYVIYTDTTFARVWEEWPAWAPIERSTAERVMALEAAVGRGADTVFTMSEHARRSFVDEYGVAADRVVNVGTAMALPPVDLGERSWSEPTALFVGQDFVRKGGDELLAVWPAVRRAVPGATLVIVGPRLRRRKLPDGVQWLGMISDRRELAGLYARASLFVLPAHFDPMPWVLGEAMGGGLGCVVTPSCGMPELVSDGVNGRVVSFRDHRMLTETLASLMADASERERLGRMAHAMMTTSGSWDDLAQRMAPRIAQAARPGSDG